MSFITCFDAANIVIDEATKRFAPLFKVDSERYKIFEQYCSIIDKLSEEYDGVSYTTTVDEETMNITISLECVYAIIEGASHDFFTLACRAINFGFSVSKDNNLVVTFTFPPIWCK